jgi:ferric-dicitrate binding protein FerR (iron transport regulator)
MTPELIERFFKNECTAEEAEAVSAYLVDHPDRVGEFLQENKWDTLPSSSMDDDKKQDIFDQISTQLHFKQTKKRNFYRFAAAAAVLAVITAGLLMKDKQPSTPPAKQADVVYTLVKINYGNEDIQLKLEDGSLILLKPSSELQYPEHFRGKERSFSLKGEARFTVAKDRSRPFIVHAGGTTTTALGTAFTISAQPDHQDIKIVLHEGKVVVKPEHRQEVAPMKDIYLLAGEEVSIDRNTHLAVRSRSKPEPTKPMKVRMPIRLPQADLVFKNQNLPEVYKTLEHEFHVRISYPAPEISDRYFTGSFKRDSLTLEKILQETALLNDLSLEKRDGNYHISIKPLTNDNQLNNH